MAIIYSYPLNDDIKPLDELVGTTEKNINGQLKTVTRNFLLADLAEFFIVDGGLQKEIILTTNGTSGASTLDQLTGVLNIPQYSGATDLGYIASALNGVVTSSTGLDATIPLANSTNAGLLNPAGFIVLGNTSGTNTGDQNLQSVTNMDSVTTNSITANSFIKSGGTGTNILLDNGSTVALSSVVGNTNLSTSQTATNFTINSDTGTDASVPLGDGTLAGATLNDYTTTEKNKLAAITGTNTGDQNLQSVLDIGSTADNANVLLSSEGGNTLSLTGGAGGSGTLFVSSTEEDGTAIRAESYDGIAINAQGGLGLAMYATSIDENLTTDKNVDVANFVNNTLKDVDFLYDCSSINVNTLDADGIRVYTNTGIGTTINQGLSGKGLVINSGTSSTGVPLTINKNGVDKLIVNQAGELIATKLIKQGGTSSQFLKADGSVDSTLYTTAQNLQSVTNLGASTTTSITANSFVKSGGISSQILAADGSVITAGTNITITGGQISSVGGSGGGGSTVNYYLNGGTSQGTFRGTTYYEFSKTAVIETGADFNISSNGYIASFITDVADPSLLLIPAGNWNLEFFFSATSNGGTPEFYVELYKYDGTTFTLITSNSTTPEGITGGTAIDAYFTPLAVPETILTVNDRLAIRVFVNASSKTITLHTQNGHLCEVITTFTAGLTALNGLQAQVQNFATGTTGTDFAINSSGSTHTFNLPSASASARGVVTTGTQTFAGDKTFTGTIGATNLSGTNTGDQDLSGYAPLVSPTFTGAVVLPSTTSIGNVSDTEIGYLDGVTSSIQEQIDAISNLVTTNRETASYTLELTDANKLVEMNVATANNLTVPLDSSVTFPIGTKIDIVQYGTGQTTIVAISGVTINSANSWLKINARYGAATLTKIGTNEWYLWGNLNA